jgi:hypothetical protein
MRLTLSYFQKHIPGEESESMRNDIWYSENLLGLTREKDLNPNVLCSCSPTIHYLYILLKIPSFTLVFNHYCQILVSITKAMPSFFTLVFFFLKKKNSNNKNKNKIPIFIFSFIPFFLLLGLNLVLNSTSPLFLALVLAK